MSLSFGTRRSPCLKRTNTTNFKQYNSRHDIHRIRIDTTPSQYAITMNKRDRTRDNFNRAVYRLMARCNKLSKNCNADFYILVRRDGMHYDYISTVDPAFPPPFESLVSLSYVMAANTNNHLIVESCLSISQEKDPIRL